MCDPHPRSVIELFTFIKMGGDRQRIVVRRLGAHTDATATTFDAEQASCYKKEDKERLLGIVEAGFGTLTPFNRIMKAVLTTGTGAGYQPQPSPTSELHSLAPPPVKAMAGKTMSQFLTPHVV